MIRFKLSTILGELRMSQRELSRLTGIRTAYISELYNELTDVIKFEKLDAICKALNCTPGELIIYVPDNEGEPARHWKSGTV